MTQGFFNKVAHNRSEYFLKKIGVIRLSCDVKAEASFQTSKFVTLGGYCMGNG
jgi:hypothetical protein